MCIRDSTKLEFEGDIGKNDFQNPQDVMNPDAAADAAGAGNIPDAADVTGAGAENAPDAAAGATGAGNSPDAADVAGAGAENAPGAAGEFPDVYKRQPMECRHGIISMRHTLFGEVVLNGKTIDFSGGLGYIEMDAGRSFPKSYIWVQSNDFKEPCSVFASVATIPFLFFHFVGTIALVLYEGREYRFATYLGAKVLACTENQIVLKQGKQQLEIWLRPDAGLKLAAPDKGDMSRTILENPSCFAKMCIRDRICTVFV